MMDTKHQLHKALESLDYVVRLASEKDTNQTANIVSGLNKTIEYVQGAIDDQNHFIPCLHVAWEDIASHMPYKIAKRLTRAEMEEVSEWIGENSYLMETYWIIIQEWVQSRYPEVYNKEHCERCGQLEDEYFTQDGLCTRCIHWKESVSGKWISALIQKAVKLFIR
jgi:hypothetical protein